MQDPFLTALQHDDELIKVVRGHLNIESLINEFLEIWTGDPKDFKKLDLRTAQKIQMCSLIGVKTSAVAAAKKLNELRNEFAHNLSSKIEKDWVDSFFNSFDQIDKKNILSSYEKVRRKNQADFRKLPPSDRFILCLIGLRSMYLRAIRELRERLASEN